MLEEDEFSFLHKIKQRGRGVVEERRGGVGMRGRGIRWSGRGGRRGGERGRGRGNRSEQHQQLSTFKIMEGKCFQISKH